MTVKLVGHREIYECGYVGWTGKKKWVKEVVATFDNNTDAMLYIENSKLKNPSVMVEGN